MDYEKEDLNNEIKMIMETADPQGAVVNARTRKDMRDTIKRFLMKQSATGSVIEFQAMRLVKDPNLQKVYDWGRVLIDPRTPVGISLFKKIVPSTPDEALSFRHTQKELIFLKCKFSLAQVNTDNTLISPGTQTWAQLGQSAEVKKGKAAVEPDLMTYSWPPGAPRPILKIVELKVGDGENKSGEHEQLMRVTHLVRKFLIPQLGLPAEIVPDVQMFFCAWKFGVKDRKAPPVFTKWAWFRGVVPTAWQVRILDGPFAFAKEVNVDSGAIQALLLSMELRRQEALYELLKKWREFGRWGAQRARVWNAINTKFRTLGYPNPFNRPPLPGASKGETPAGAGARSAAREAFGGRPARRLAASAAALKFKNKKRLAEKRQRAASEAGAVAAKSAARAFAAGALTPQNLSHNAQLFIQQLSGRLTPAQISMWATALHNVATAPRLDPISEEAARTPRVVSARAAYEAARAEAARANRENISASGLFSE